MVETYTISTQVYYHDIKKCYTRIFVVDRPPSAPLSQITRTVRAPKLSPFKESAPCCSTPSCTHALFDQTTKQLLEMHEQSLLLNFLLGNGYTIETELTKLFIKNRVKADPTRQLLFVISKTNGLSS